MATESVGPTSPMFPEIGVVALVPDDWDHLWQPRHHVLVRLARYFHVVWVNPAERWKRMLFGPRASLAPRPDHVSGFHIYRPDRWLPTVYGPRPLAEWFARTRVRRAEKVLRRQGCKRIVLYLWRPKFIGALSATHHEASFYHIDDEYTFETDPAPLSEQERNVISRVDRVIVHSPRLMETKGGINAQTSFIPNGADFASYSRPQPEPADLVPVPGPRIGYCGMVKRQIDWPLLDEVIQRCPDASFVFAGKRARHYEDPAKGTEDDVRLLDELGRRDNVWFLGEKTAEELTAYPQHFDVCLLPYRLTGYTHCIYPMKLHEYLAAGRPVIGTRIRSLLDFSSIVSLVTDAAEMEAAIRECLTEREQSVERVAERRAVAERHDWDHMVDRIAEQMCDQLGLRLPSP